jgi:hypothetical protein
MRADHRTPVTRHPIRLFPSMCVMALIVVASHPIAQTARPSLEVLWQYDTGG